MRSSARRLGPAIRRLRRRHRLPRWANLRLLTALVAVSVLVGSGWLVLRDASVVAVRDVKVVGASGTQAAAIREALTSAGEDMTTLHVRDAVLREAVAPFAAVKSVSATAEFPHSLRVRVVEHVPVAQLVSEQGTAVPVAADGTILRGLTADTAPTLKLRLPPVGDRVTDRRTLTTVRLLAEAPAPLRAKVSTAFRGARGLTVHLSDGPTVHFGSGVRLRAKWAALTAVLASPASRGATAIDVRVPEHPAAAGLEQASTQLGQPSTGN